VTGNVSGGDSGQVFARGPIGMKGIPGGKHTPAKARRQGR
jgi:hypothetical protein